MKPTLVYYKILCTAFALLGIFASHAKAQNPLPQFTDIAAQAGLVHPTIYGGVENKKFIIETNG